ncbi:cell wall-binding repeat-containing protein [Bacillus coahuilensis]|uniref:cell wall-binding repeat-containing protein n=1 Tax=Bacillus coahuilensis TaxID=408580 RepID=UPI000750D5E0|nr:cell wall-binding repeat-containing protein [Bacillus coahuilensis]
MKKRLLLFILFIIALQTGGGLQTAASHVERIQGNDRYETAVKISQQAFNTTETAVIARGDDFPDALSGAPLAYSLNAPILLTGKDTLNTKTKAELLRLQVKEVVLLGSEGAISKHVQASIQQLGIKVSRIGGKDRFETSARIAEEIHSVKAFVANGHNFPDALAVAAYAAKEGVPILLTNRDVLPSYTKSALSGKQTYIIGGEGVVSGSIEKLLPNASRYGGSNRYETARVVTERFPLGKDHAYVATGENFADALTGSVLAAKENSPILLVSKSSIPTSTNKIASQYTRFSILGGTASVSNSVENALPNGTALPTSSISIGMSKSTLVTKFGTPDRIDTSSKGIETYNYISDYSQYMQVGLVEGKVASYYSNGLKSKNPYGVSIGMSEGDAKSKASQVGTLISSSSTSSIYKSGSDYITLNFDTLNNKKLMSVKIENQEVYHSAYIVHSTSSQQKATIRDGYEKQILDITNAFRVAQGFQPLKDSEKATSSSRKHSEDMATQDYFSHTNLDGKSPFDRMREEGISYRSAGENIAQGQRTPSDVVEAWMRSSGHRNNILNGTYTYLGNGVAFHSTKWVYYTQNFYSTK